MGTRTFAWSPTTMELPDQGRLFIVENARYDDVESEVGVEDGYQVRWIGVGEVESLDQNEMRFTNENGTRYVLRPTTPEDGAAWDYGIRIPLPVEIIGAMMSNNIQNPTLAAAVDDEGDVHTIVLETGMGLYARYGRNWLRLGDISSLDQLEMIAVPSTDLEHYDMADEQGNMLSINDLNPIDQPVESVDLTAPEPVTAAAAPVLIASADDLPAAIERAATDEGADARWYVTRRARALGWTEPLPWE
jgi:hypothetical protein